ncbi:MAG: helix-hairpin-helix domain-containing protein [Saprospiraceae bacterium]
MILRKIIRQFHFTKAERHGAAALLFLIGCTVLAPELYRWQQKPEATDFSDFEKQIAEYRAANRETTKPVAETAALFFFDPNNAPVETLLALGIPERVAHTIARYRERGGRFRTADDLGKIYTLPEEVFERLRPYVRIGSGNEKAAKKEPGKAEPEAFAFDPNTAGESDLLRLGLPQDLVRRLLRYREKGGYFFEKADFRKLYGMTDAAFQRLEPYIAITRSEAAIRPAAYAGGRAKAAEPSNIDVNSAAAQDWQQLPGIGAARAGQIVRFREKLGGFVRIEQVAETFGLPDSVFQTIQPYLRVEAPLLAKINLNTATEAELNNHPYINFKQAKLIAAYREQHGAFTKPQDIQRIAALSDKDWLSRIMPYLSVE